MQRLLYRNLRRAALQLDSKASIAGNVKRELRRFAVFLPPALQQLDNQQDSLASLLRQAFEVPVTQGEGIRAEDHGTCPLVPYFRSLCPV